MPAGARRLGEQCLSFMEELECWEGQKMGLGTFCSSMRCCVHRLARDRRPLFPQPPTSPAALGNSCVTVACASMRAGTVTVMRTVMTSLMNAIAPPPCAQPNSFAVGQAAASVCPGAAMGKMTVQTTVMKKTVRTQVESPSVSPPALTLGVGGRGAKGARPLLSQPARGDASLLVFDGLPFPCPSQ